MKKYLYTNKEININNIQILNKSVGLEISSDGNYVTIYFIKIDKKIKLEKDLIEYFNINKTGDNNEYKVCDRCFRHLKTSYFSNNRIKKNAITKRPSCKDCRKIKDGIGISNKDRELWESKKPKNYSIFECPICKKQSIAGISKIVLDHNHKNGKVRGYLCESCNTGIGRFDDDPKIIKNAIEWLK